ncbi:MAG: lysoplasmalogenase family protein [Coriobacteriales bacterium]|nr:lysoplasmalogenase family protein [Coriobacteriales bacterium]
MTSKTLNRLYLIVSLLFFVVLWSLKILEDTHVIGFHTLPVRILVPGYVGITVLYNLLARGFERTRLITVALLFAMLAEIINAMNMDFGLLFFAVTHACLMVFHWKKTAHLENASSTAGASARITSRLRPEPDSPVPAEPHLPYARYRRLELISAVVMAVLFLVIVVSIELNLHEQNLEYELVVPLYMVILSLMAWRSICTFGERQSGRIIAGSLLFYACDVFILAELTAPNFSNPPLTLLILSWLCYLPALFLLSCIGKDIFTFKRWPNF